MKKLTNAQMTLLAAAANGGGAVPPAGSHMTVASLIKRGLLTRKSSKAGEASVVATKAGKAELAAWKTEAPAPEVGGNGDVEVVAEPTLAPGPQGKLGVLVSLLRHPGGATLTAMMTATGWQAHSVRGAMAGAIKKKLQLPIISEKSRTTRIWRIVETRA